MIRPVAFAAIAAVSFAQSTGRPEFEAAVIRPNNSCAAGGRGQDNARQDRASMC